MKRFILNDESVNRYGYRILTDGIKLDAFKKNPVLLFGHNDYSLPLGKWTDLRKEDGKLTGVPEFDEDDGMAVELSRKVEKGYVCAASLRHRPIETSDDPALLTKGQRRHTVTKTEVLEISIVVVPGNSGCHALSDGMDVPELNLPVLGEAPDKELSQKIEPEMDKKKLAEALGLDLGADETEFFTRIETLKAAELSLKAKQVDEVLALGKAKGMVNADNEAAMRKQVELNPEGAKLMFEAAPTPVVPAATPETKPEADAGGLTLSAAIKKTGASASGDARKDWSFDDWGKKDPEGLLKMKRTEEDRYNALALKG